MGFDLEILSVFHLYVIFILMFFQIHRDIFLQNQTYTKINI